MRLSSIKKRLGDILVDVGIISASQLKEALDIQKRNGGKLGAILSQMGVINEEVMLAFLGKQCGVSYISLSEYGEISPDAIRSVPESIVRRQNLIPIAKEGTTLTVAMADPFNVFAIDDIKLMTGYDVQVVIASESEIKAAIDLYYAHQPDLETILLAVPPPPDNDPEEKASGELIGALVYQARKAGARTILLEPQPSQVRVRYRIDGVLYEQTRLSKQLMDVLSKQITALARGRDVPGMIREGSARLMIENEEVHLNISCVPTVTGENLVIEIIESSPLNFELEKLGFEPEIFSIYKKVIESPKGLNVIIGPSNSGKTTTLYASMCALNYPDRNILSLSERAEFVVPGVAQLQVGAERTSEHFALSRVIERYDPDIVFLGEIDDQFSAKIAVDAALSGRTVFATMLAADFLEVIGTLDRFGIEPMLTAQALNAVVSQRLMRTVCPECKENYSLSPATLRQSGIEVPGAADAVPLWRGKGCVKCNYTGYRGSTGVFDLMEFDETIRRLITERAPEADLRAAASKKTTLSLSDTALRKVMTGISTAEELVRITRLPV